MAARVEPLEPMYSIQEISRRWHVHPDSVRKAFRGRAGVVNISTSPGKPAWRVPASLLLEVLVEHGYDPQRAQEMLRALRELEEG